MRLLAIALLVACGSKDTAPTSTLSPDDRKAAMTAATACSNAATSLAPSFQAVGPRLSSALKLDRAEAQRLLRDSIELLISTRELLCNVSAGAVETVRAKAPSDTAVVEANAKIQAALAHLAKARAAYDELLGAATAASPPPDEAALVERFSNALLGQ